MEISTGKLITIIRDCMARTIEATGTPLEVAKEEMVQIATETVLRIKRLN